MHRSERGPFVYLDTFVLQAAHFWGNDLFEPECEARGGRAYPAMSFWLVAVLSGQ